MVVNLIFVQVMSSVSKMCQFFSSSTTVVIFNICSGEVCSRVDMCCSGAIFVCEKHFYFVLLSENAQGAFF